MAGIVVAGREHSSAAGVDGVADAAVGRDGRHFQSYLSQIERGLREPSEQVLKSLADSLQLSADSLRPPPQEPDQASAVLEAIAADPDLTGQQRKALQESYRAFREITIEHRRDKGRQRRTR